MPHYKHLNSYHYIYYRYIFENLVEKCVKDIRLLLDAGCGNGSSLSFPLDNVEFVSIDLSRVNIMTCRKRWTKRNYVIADLNNLPFKGGVFGGVLSADVLEHVDNANVSLKELARITQKGGFFIGCSTNLLNPLLFFDTKFSMLAKVLEKKFASPGHYTRHTRFSPSSLVNTLKSAGYQIDHLCLLGHQVFSYRHSPVVFSLIWMFFDRFTKKTPLLYLKEALIWQATLV